MAVFCVDCLNYVSGKKAFYPHYPPEYYDEKCMSPENFKDSHKSPNEVPISTPKIINFNNDCPWFIPIVASSSSSGGQDTTPKVLSSSSSSEFIEISSSSSSL